MDRDVGPRVIGDGLVVADVVPVAVRRYDQLERPVTRGEFVSDPGEGRRGCVDGDRLARPFVREDVHVRRDRPDDTRDVLHRGSVAGSGAGTRGSGCQIPMAGLLGTRRRDFAPFTAVSHAQSTRELLDSAAYESPGGNSPKDGRRQLMPARDSGLELGLHALE